MAEYLYRIRSGEVVRMSSAGFDAVPEEFAAVVDPPAPNGADLAVPKIWNGTAVRNATAEEIDMFHAAAALDARQKEYRRAKERLNQSAGIPLRGLARAINEQLVRLARSEPLLDEDQLLSRVGELIDLERGEL